MKSPFVNGSQAWPLRCTKNEPVQVISGDARSKLLEIPDQTFHTCVTSPPYWGMRDYGHLEQIGAENNLKEYVESLVAFFREVRRVLRADGTFWLNIGNTYTSGGRAWRDTGLPSARFGTVKSQKKRGGSELSIVGLCLCFDLRSNDVLHGL